MRTSDLVRSSQAYITTPLPLLRNQYFKLVRETRDNNNNNVYERKERIATSSPSGTKLVSMTSNIEAVH